MSSEENEKRLNAIDLWIAQKDEWWYQQHRLNERCEEKEKTMELQIATTAADLSTHQTECIPHREKVESMDNKLDTIGRKIDSVTSSSTRDRSLLKGGYIGVCLVLTAVASLLGLIIAAYSAFK